MLKIAYMALILGQSVAFASDLIIKDDERIKWSLLNSPIKKEIKEISGHRSRIYLVELEDNTQALFKERACKGFSGLFCEVMAYKFSHDVLQLEHTVPPTVPKFYRARGLYGTLQPFINSPLTLSTSLNESIKNANTESYDNLQIFLFCTAMQDVNIDGIIPWYKGGKINFTYVDSECAFSSEQTYGECSPGLRNTLSNYTNPKHVFTSKYTTSFPSITIEILNRVNAPMLENLWKSTELEVNSIGLYPYISEEDKKIYLEAIIHDISSILAAAKTSNKEKN